MRLGLPVIALYLAVSGLLILLVSEDSWKQGYARGLEHWYGGEVRCGDAMREGDG